MLVIVISLSALAAFCLGGYLLGIREGRLAAEADAAERETTIARSWRPPSPELGRGHLRLVAPRPPYDWSADDFGGVA